MWNSLIFLHGFYNYSCQKSVNYNVICRNAFIVTNSKHDVKTVKGSVCCVKELLIITRVLKG